MSLLIVFAGIISYTKLAVREYPDIDPPVVTITTVYPGASSKVIETEITDLIEEEVSGVEGIRTLVSSSRDQVSTVIVEFVLERDIDIAAQDLRDKISRIARKLPENADDPIIAKADADAQPIMWIGVRSDTRDLIDLAEYVDKEVKNYFQNIPGVSKVIFGGERRRSIQVLLDPKRLAYYGLTVLDMQDALRKNNLELPAGTILSTSKEFSVNVNAKLVTREDYANIVIKDSSSIVNSGVLRSSIVRLGDVADVRVGAENDKSFVRFNGQQGFGLGIVRQAKSNTVDISNKAKKMIDNLQNKLPKDISLWVGFDAAQFIRLSMEELYNTILQATVLVLLVIFIFLRNLRSTIIPGIAIPISLIGVMVGVQVCGFTLNQMTLLGLIISIGIVVDDSIIVLENIYRYIEEGMDAKSAAKKGTEEITLAVMATTFVLVAIFLPVAFLSGVTGRLLSEFAFSLCFATVISAFVSLTIAPMLASKMFKQHQDPVKPSPKQHLYQKLKDFLERVLTKFEQSYANSLKWFLKNPKSYTIIVFLITIGFSVIIFPGLPKDFIPDEDKGSFLVVFQSPRGSNIDLLDKEIRKVENVLSNIPEIKTVISVAAFGRDAPGKVTEGIIIARLVDWKDRAKKVFGIVGPLYPVLFAMPDTFKLPIIPKSGPDTGFGAQPIQIVIKSNNIDFLVKASAEITREAFSLPEILFAKSNLTLDKPELTIEIDRDKALSMGVSMEEISRSVELLFSGVDVTDFNQNGEKYDVILKLPRYEKQEIQKLGEFAIRNKAGQLIQISNFIRIKQTIGAEERNHHNRKKSVTIEASPKPGITAPDGLFALEKLINAKISKMENVPADFEIDFLGTSKEVKDSSSALYFGFFVALIFAYLFLAGQFESFVNPLIIMLTVPLALAGALFGIWVFQFFPFITGIIVSILGPSFAWLPYVIPQFKSVSLNLYSQVGMIMLIGIATKNGILLVEFMNQLIEQGKTVYEAVTTAAKLRLRPVLMTALSTIVGLVPTALAMGVGTESRQALGVVIIFGIGISTLLTLYVIPSVFYLFETRKRS
jgi:hydrophobe/amphiphile efflux-1 (HAE1) family protein